MRANFLYSSNQLWKTFNLITSNLEMHAKSFYGRKAFCCFSPIFQFDIEINTKFFEQCKVHFSQQLRKNIEFSSLFSSVTKNHLNNNTWEVNLCLKIKVQEINKRFHVISFLFIMYETKKSFFEGGSILSLKN